MNKNSRTLKKQHSIFEIELSRNQKHGSELSASLQKELAAATQCSDCQQILPAISRHLRVKIGNDMTVKDGKDSIIILDTSSNTTVSEVKILTSWSKGTLALNWKMTSKLSMIFLQKIEKIAKDGGKHFQAEWLNGHH